MYEYGADDATAVEIKPVEWDFCDGVASVEVVGNTLRVVLYVADVESGKEVQKRINKKLIMPLAAVRDGIDRVERALGAAGPALTGPPH